MSVSNAQRYVINVKNECARGSGACRQSKSRNTKANVEAELPISVSPQTFEILSENQQLKWLKGAIKSVKRYPSCWSAAQCSVFSICSSMFSTYDDPLNFARALVNVTLKSILHFQSIFEQIDAAITMSNNLFPAVCNFPLSMKGLWVNFDEDIFFLEFLSLSGGSFLQKQPRISALFCNGYQHFPQAYCSDDVFRQLQAFYGSLELFLYPNIKYFLLKIHQKREKQLTSKIV